MTVPADATVYRRDRHRDRHKDRHRDMYSKNSTQVFFLYISLCLYLYMRTSIANRSYVVVLPRDLSVTTH